MLAMASRLLHKTTGQGYKVIKGVKVVKEAILEKWGERGLSRREKWGERGQSRREKWGERGQWRREKWGERGQWRRQKLEGEGAVEEGEVGREGAVRKRQLLVERKHISLVLQGLNNKP